MSTDRSPLLVPSLILGFLFLVFFAFFISQGIQTFAPDDELPVVEVHSYGYDSYSGDLYYEASGTGTLISSDGHILTNFHVVSDGSYTTPMDAFEICFTVAVESSPDCHYTAGLVDYDIVKDLAVLQLHEEDIFEEEVGTYEVADLNFDVLNVGEELMVVGYPGIGENTVTFTSGQVAGYLSDVNGLWVKTDAKIDSGNSGGAVFNDYGELVGVPTFTIGEDELLGYLKPLSDVEDFVKEALGEDAPRFAEQDRALQAELIAFQEAKESSTYVHEYPAFSIELEPGWSVTSVEDTVVYLEHEDTAYVMGILMDPFPFELTTEEYLRWMKHYENDYESLHYFYPAWTDVSGLEAYEYDYANVWNYGHGYTFAWGTYGFDIYVDQDSTTNADLDDYDDRIADLDAMMLSLTLETDEKPTYSPYTSFDHELTDFQVSSAAGWEMLVWDSWGDSMSFYHPDSLGYIDLYNFYMSYEEWLAPDLALEDWIKYSSGYYDVDVLERSWVTIDGQPWYKMLYTYEIGRNEYKEVTYQYEDWTNERLLQFTYGNVEPEYDAFLPGALEILEGIQITQE